ncbi:MAG: hypothetical protein CM1200mP30_24410 [Pseudomonadota bacterium]|nr:MAG: hypothetical protein CM1200mP30_24410 [Pseudomonadota bacterium]
MGAEEREKLRPGGLVVEGTAGNTGIGLGPGWKFIGIPHIDSHSGYPKSGEKRYAEALRCRAREVPAVPYRDENNYVKVSGRIADEFSKTEPKGAIWANQFDNVAQP